LLSKIKSEFVVNLRFKCTDISQTNKLTNKMTATHHVFCDEYLL